jgi:putative DNA primase/helicase
MQEFKRSTAGRWLGILGSYGVDETFFRTAHGPCPLCGGKDRYRWIDKGGNGEYFCSGCGPGDGLELLSRYTGKKKGELMREISPKVDEYKAVKKNPAPNGDARIRKIMKESKPVSSFAGGIVRKYLKSRGLKASALLREHPGLPYYDGNKVLGVYPAMIALVETGTALASLHVTYLTPDGHKAPVPSPKKLLTPRCDMTGASIRLTKPYPVLGIAEGVETALAVIALYSKPCWAAATAGMLEKFVPPEGTTSIIIYADNDASFTGQKSAYTLAQTLTQKGFGVTVVMPRLIGDFADEVKNV